VEVINNLDEKQYLDFLAKFPEVNFLQSPEWASLYQQLGYDVVRSGVSQGDDLQATWLAIVKSAKRARYLEIPGGPVMDYENEDLVKLVFAELRQLAKQKNCVFIRFRPPVRQNPQALQILQQNGSKNAPMHLHAEHTRVIDITPDEDTLLANMRRQTRYEVRQVAKKGVAIASYCPTEEDINQFYDLQQKTAKRHNFIPSSRQFLQATRQAFDDKLQLYTAKKDGVLLNMALVIFWGREAIYHEATSTPEARRQPGAYGIVWQIMRDAKAKGLSRVNLWGIAYNDNPKHRYAGVTTFKRGFGGQDVVYISAQDIVIKPINYLVDWLIETVRRKMRGL